MSRNLVVCCDGTWCTPEQAMGVLPCPTNVVRLHNLCVVDTTQLTYYHPGVGAEGNLVERILGGGIGLGLSRNILSAYRWLCDHYRSGDLIFLFGFSRGAYTVRSLGGFITACGLLDLAGLTEQQAWNSIETAYDRGYRKREAIGDWAADRRFLAGDGPADHVPIHFIGVWDTVGALGVPDDLVLLDQLLDDPGDYRFHDTELNPLIRHGRHALAIDEQRASFAPTLWTGASRPPGTSVVQLWFAGTHEDVGGGHVQCGLSDCALRWMIDEAVSLGLRIDSRLAGQIAPDPRGMVHDSATGIWKHLRTLPRAVPAIIPGNVGQRTASQVQERHDLPPLAQAPYWPTLILGPGQSASVGVFARERWNATGLYLESGVTYELSARGEWLDGPIASGPEGHRDGTFRIGEVAYLFGDAIGEAEALYKRLTGKERSDWWGSRRREDAPWFALIGMIANQPNMDASGTAIEGETFAIGPGTGITPDRSGYLYAYANDAWKFYANNRGQVTLTVRRP